jgi:hypothetical protein
MDTILKFVCHFFYYFEEAWKYRHAFFAGKERYASINVEANHVESLIFILKIGLYI